MEKEYPHRLGFTDKHKKAMSRAAALLNKDKWSESVGIGMTLVENYSKEYVKGNTEVAYLPPKVAGLLSNNQDFFDALCEEGVIEWLAPLVLTGKSREVKS